MLASGALQIRYLQTKTIQFHERVFTQLIEPNLVDRQMCLTRAYLAMLHNRHGVLRHVARYAADESFTRRSFIALMNSILPAIEPSPEMKGVLTKHSWRRSYVQLAVQAGARMEDCMLFGDWRTAPSFGNYAEGAPIPSWFGRNARFDDNRFE